MGSWKNQIALRTLVPFIATYTVLWLVLSGLATRDEVLKNWQSLVAIGTVSFVMALFQDLVPGPVGDFLLFGQWKEALPGYRAFDKDTEYGRIVAKKDVKDFEKRSEMTAVRQNGEFYRIYDKYREKGPVSNSSFRFVQWRDLAIVALVYPGLVLAYSIYRFGLFYPVAWILFGAAAIFAGLCGVAARRNAYELVEYVLLFEFLDSKAADES